MKSRNVTIALLVGLLIGAVATYALAGPSLGRTVTSVSTTTETLPAVTSTTTVTINSTQAVRNAYAAYLQNIKSENLTALAAEYENNATFVFGYAPSTGALAGGGHFTGVANISIFYQSFFIPFTTVNLANESYSMSLSGNGSEATVKSNFTIYGNETLTLPFGVPPVYADRVMLKISYAPSGNSWLIFSESWTLVATDGCPAITTPPCSTLLASPP